MRVYRALVAPRPGTQPAQSIFSLDAAFQDLVTEQQPQVAAQLPAGGDVSPLPAHAKHGRVFGMLAVAWRCPSPVSRSTPQRGESRPSPSAAGPFSRYSIPFFTHASKPALCLAADSARAAST